VLSSDQEKDSVVSSLQETDEAVEHFLSHLCVVEAEVGQHFLLSFEFVEDTEVVTESFFLHWHAVAEAVVVEDYTLVSMESVEVG